MPNEQTQFNDCLILAVESPAMREPLVKLVPKLPNEELFKEYLGKFGAELLWQLADPTHPSVLHVRHARADGRVRTEDLIAYISKERPWLGSEPSEVLILEAQPITVYELRSWDKRPYTHLATLDEQAEDDDEPEAFSADVSAEVAGITISQRREEVREAREQDNDPAPMSGSIEASDEGITIREAREQVRARRNAEASIGGATAAEVSLAGQLDGYVPAFDEYEDEEDYEEEDYA